MQLASQPFTQHASSTFSSLRISNTHKSITNSSDSLMKSNTVASVRNEYFKSPMILFSVRYSGRPTTSPSCDTHTELEHSDS